MIKVEVEQIEIIKAGVDTVYTDPKERFLALHKLADELERTDHSLSNQIRRRLMNPAHWAHECIAAGVCPGGPYLLEDPPDDGRVRPEGTRHCPDCGDVTPPPQPKWMRVGA